MPFPNRVYTGSECRELDRQAIEKFGIKGITLMRRAARFAFDTLLHRWPDTKRLKVYCGSGNNAGDGYVLAGIALNSGIKVTVVAVGDSAKLKGDAKTAYAWYADQETSNAQEENGGVEVVVDALLGTGTSGPVRPVYQKAIDEINAGESPVLALDLPSGLDAETGKVLGKPPVSATVTTTFIGNKRCLVTGKGVNYAGQVLLDTLEVPMELYDNELGIPTIPTSKERTSLPKRQPGSYKNQAGHVMIVGGDLGTGGAAILAGEAALRTGAGLVSVVTRPEHVAAFLSRRPELMVRSARTGESIQDLINRVDVIAIGPGLGNRRWGQELLKQVLAASKPKVIDADGLNLLTTLENPVLKEAVLTPHPGEAARLLETDTGTIEGDRVKAANALASKYNCQVILKGAGSVLVDPSGGPAILAESIPALATGGSGDVLTGVIGACIATGLSLSQGSETGVYLHAEAGKRANAASYPKAVVASDIVNALQPW